MPKKTKKEKIIAELRRKLKSVEVGNWKLDTREPTIPISKSQNIQPHPPAGGLTSTFYLPTSYIIKDLRKTFLLAGLAISLELVVYWIIELGGSKLLQFLPIKNF